MRRIRAAVGTRRQQQVLERIYPTLPEVTIDYGILERAKNVIACPGQFRWIDIGNWNSLFEALGKDYVGKHGLVTLDAKDIIAHSPNKLVAVVGASNLAVVETDNAILVCDRNSVGRVKDMVSQLEHAAEQETRYRKYL